MGDSPTGRVAGLDCATGPDMRGSFPVHLSGLLCMALWLAPSLAQGTWQLPCVETDTACLQKAIRQHPATRLETWKAALAKPSAERIGAAPAALLEYLTLDNILNGYPDRPQPAQINAGLRSDVDAAIAELPPTVWALFQGKLAGVYFVEGLGGTGYTDYVFDAAGKAVAAFIVLDAAVLATQTANEWATWKERTPFAPDGNHRLVARIEADVNNNRKNAIQYILLHELGHVLTVGTDLHPAWNVSPKDVSTNRRFPFFDLSWRIDRARNLYLSLFDNRFPQRARTVYYFGPKLDAAEMSATYENLRATNFPSLYAATSPGDDFAEAFASYVHVILMQRPWQITISQDSRSPQVFAHCWDESRCSAKRKLLERLLRPVGLTSKP